MTGGNIPCSTPCLWKTEAERQQARANRFQMQRNRALADRDASQRACTALRHEIDVLRAYLLDLEKKSRPGGIYGPYRMHSANIGMLTEQGN